MGTLTWISVTVAATSCTGSFLRAQPGPIVAWGENSSGQAQSQSGSFIAVSGTSATSVAIRADGSLFAWGDMNDPAAQVPSGTFTHIDGGASTGFYIARRTDGSLTGWGLNNTGQASPPPGTFHKASAGANHALGIRTDGSLAYWGAQWAGSVPAGNDFVDVAAGDRFSLALRSNGTIEAWGFNTHGQLNVPPGTYTSVVAMFNTGAAVRSDGTVAVWGAISSALALEGVVVSKIVASEGTVIALLPNGTLSSLSGPPPIVPSGSFAGIGAGQNHWFAVVPSPGTGVVLLIVLGGCLNTRGTRGATHEESARGFASG